MIRKIARPMLASVFVWDGVDGVRNAQAHAAEGESVLRTLRAILPAEYRGYLPRDPETVMQGISGAKAASGVLFGLGKAPRLAAGVLALTHVPSLLGRNAFWNATGEEAKATARNGFVTNLALLGALAIITQDTEGNPSLRWRAQKASKHTAARIQSALPTKSESEKLADTVTARAADYTAQAQSLLADTSAKAQSYVEDNRGDWEATGRALVHTAKDYLDTAKDYAQEFVDEHREDWDRLSDVQALERAEKLQKRADAAFAQAFHTVGKQL